MKKKFIIFLIGISVVFMITAGILLFSGPRMKYQPSLKTFEAVVNLPPDDAVPFNNDAVDYSIKGMPAVNDENISRGKVYYGYYCVFCHGENGKGNGPVGESYIPKPANLTGKYLKQYDSLQLNNVSFTGVGHSPVLERVVPSEWKYYITLYIESEFIKPKR
jgi:hypothetical protein